MNKKIMLQTILVVVMTFTFIGTAYSLTCGDTIVEDTTLECDLDCPDTAIIIGAAGITVDLNGYTLRGDGEGVGVDNPCGHHGVTIKNGVIDNFRNGIALSGACDNEIIEIEVRNSTNSGIQIQYNPYCHSSVGNRILECNIVGKKNLSIYGIDLTDAYDNVIRENIVMKNLTGLNLDDSVRNTVTENLIKNNTIVDITEDSDSYDNYFDENMCKKSDPPEICQ